MKNKDGGEGGELNRDGGLIYFPPLKRRGGLFERGGLIEDLRYTVKGHVEIGYLTNLGALKLKLNRDQVMTLEIWLKISNFVTASPKTI